MSGLDPASPSSAYLAGRLFAALEALELAATGRHDVHLGKFPAVIANPRTATNFVTSYGTIWLKRLTTRQPAAAAEFAARFDELLPRIASGGWSRDRTADQSLFLLGYHHQRHHDDRESGAVLTTTALAEKLGVTLPTLRQRLSRWAKAGWALEVGHDRVTGEKTWLWPNVQEAMAAMPGQGARTDKHRADRAAG